MNVMDDTLFTSIGPNFGGIRHGEGGISATTSLSGGSSQDGSAMQVASGDRGETHGGGGEPHDKASMDVADEWACPIIEEPIPDDII